MPNIRMLPPGDGLHNTITVNGRTYTAAPSAPIDVLDADALVMSANGWFCPFGTNVTVGPTSTRPTRQPNGCLIDVGTRYYDTTLSKLIMWDGAAWRDPSGAAV